MSGPTRAQLLEIEGLDRCLHWRATDSPRMATPLTHARRVANCTARSPRKTSALDYRYAQLDSRISACAIEVRPGTIARK